MDQRPVGSCEPGCGQDPIHGGVEFLEAARVLHHEVGAGALRVEGELGGLAALDLTGLPAAAFDGTLVALREGSIDEHQVVTACDEAVLGIVLEQQGDVEHDARDPLLLGLGEDGQDPRTNARVDPALEAGAGPGVVEDPPGQGGAVDPALEIQEPGAELGLDLGRERCQGLVGQGVRRDDAPRGARQAGGDRALAAGDASEDAQNDGRFDKEFDEAIKSQTKTVIACPVLP